MNEELQAKLAESIEHVNQWLEAAGSVVADQAPLVVEEMVLYGRVVHTATSLLCLAIIIGVPILAVKGVAWSLDAEDSKAITSTAVFGVSAFGGPMLAFLSLVGLAHHLSPMAMVWLAPRLYVLERLSEMAS